MKKIIDVEKLLHWTMREELPKGQAIAASAWDIVSQYSLQSRGGNVALKYFHARETRKGVSAAPWNARYVFTGTFIKGGLFSKRVGLNLGGQVFARTGAGRVPIVKQKSGLFIPKGMISGATKQAFLSTVASVLPRRLQHEIAAILGGHA